MADSNYQNAITEWGAGQRNTVFHMSQTELAPSYVSPFIMISKQSEETRITGQVKAHPVFSELPH